MEKTAPKPAALKLACVIAAGLMLSIGAARCQAALSPWLQTEATNQFEDFILWLPDGAGSNTTALNGTSWNRSLSVNRVGAAEPTVWRFAWSVQHRATRPGESNGPLFSGTFDYDTAGGATGYSGADVPHGEGIDRFGFSVFRDTSPAVYYVSYGVQHIAALRLNISAPAPGTVRLGWSTNFPGYTVEQASNVTARAWRPVTNTVTISDGQFEVSVPSVNAQRIFRLQSP